MEDITACESSWPDCDNTFCTTVGENGRKALITHLAFGENDGIDEVEMSNGRSRGCACRRKYGANTRKHGVVLNELPSRGIKP